MISDICGRTPIFSGNILITKTFANSFFVSRAGFESKIARKTLSYDINPSKLNPLGARNLIESTPKAVNRKCKICRKRFHFYICDTNSVYRFHSQPIAVVKLINIYISNSVRLAIYLDKQKMIGWVSMQRCHINFINIFRIVFRLDVGFPIHRLKAPNGGIFGHILSGKYRVW